MTARSFPLWAVLVCVASAAAVHCDETARIDPLAPPLAERRDPVTYDVELQIAVTAPYQTRQLRVWIPVPYSDHGQELLSSEITSFPEDVPPRIAAEPLFGNRFAYFEFANPRGAQVLRHKLRIRVWEQRWQVTPARIVPVTNWPASFEPFRRRETQAIVLDDRFERLLVEILPRRRGPLEDFRAVMNWVDGHFRYDHANASLQASSVHALEQMSGHCSDYHGFCAAMGRALGQPTRIAYGLHAFAKGSPSHCKLEAFLLPYGWVSFDVSETQKLAQTIRSREDLPEEARGALAAAARRRLESGFRDNTWFGQTRGTDYDLEPRAASRVPVVRTIYAEADGRPLPEPDPSSSEQTTFAWMTAHRFSSDRSVTYPFQDLETLREWAVPPPGSPVGATTP